MCTDYFNKGDGLRALKHQWKVLGTIASFCVKEKLFSELCVKKSKEDLIQDHCSGGEKLNSTLNAAYQG